MFGLLLREVVKSCLKRDMSEFLEIWRLQDLAKKLSEYIVFPISQCFAEEEPFY